MTRRKKHASRHKAPDEPPAPDSNAATPGRWRDIILALIPGLLFLAQATFFLTASPYARTDFPLDDAWIHRVYAKSFAFGDGFAYNPGQQEAGATSPLWAIVSAPPHWLEGFGIKAVVAAVKGIGVLLGLAALLFAQRLANRMTGSKIAGMLAATVFLLEPRFVFSALSGMETTLLLALILCGLDATLSKRWKTASVCFGLTPVTRPEALLVLPLYGVLLLVLRRRFREVSKPLVWVIPLIPMALWCVFCLSVNGHLLPNTFYLKAKASHLGAAGLQTAWQVLTQHGLPGTFLLFVGVAALAAWTWRRGRPADAWLSAALILFPFIFAIAVTCSRPVSPGGYYWTRWVDPASMLLSLAIATGMAVLVGAGFARSVQPGHGVVEAPTVGRSCDRRGQAVVRRRRVTIPVPFDGGPPLSSLV